MLLDLFLTYVFINIKYVKMNIQFSEAIEQMEQMRDKVENAKLTLFINKNRDFLQQAFEDNA
ncbi:hypothetical protein LR010_02180 [Candidatus Gracilibacteria bacterium]|nr:hypothetical protein [Candidatus Gracilibacteria bacterium]